MGWGPLGVSAGDSRIALTVSMDAGVHDGGGRGARGGVRCTTRRALPSKASPNVPQARPASSRGRDSLQHELSPRPCLQPDVTTSLPTPCASASSRWHSLGTADGSSNCQWVRSTKGEPRQSGQPLADMESSTCSVLAWHPTAASARSHPTIALRELDNAMAFLCRNDRMARSASQGASDARLLRCGSGRNDGAGGVKCAGRFLNGRCGAGAVVVGTAGRIEKPPDPMWAGGLSLLVALDAKLAVSACL